jgi:hypothetical protein
MVEIAEDIVPAFVIWYTILQLAYTSVFAAWHIAVIGFQACAVVVSFVLKSAFILYTFVQSRTYTFKFPDVS